MSAPDPIEQHLTLSAYLAQIQKAIRTAVPDSSWVVAELSDFKRRPNGHCYMDIMESREGPRSRRRGALCSPTSPAGYLVSGRKQQEACLKQE
ncbi:exodeoxyribonuclease VII large subunit [Pseudomonas aeruginosa]